MCLLTIARDALSWAAPALGSAFARNVRVWEVCAPAGPVMVKFVTERLIAPETVPPLQTKLPGPSIRPWSELREPWVKASVPLSTVFVPATTVEPLVIRSAPAPEIVVPDIPVPAAPEPTTEAETALSFREAMEELEGIRSVAAPLREAARVHVEELRPAATAGPGRVGVARLLTVEDEAAHVAEWIASRRASGAQTAAVLCRKRSQFAPVIDALEKASTPYRPRFRGTDPPAGEHTRGFLQLPGPETERSGAAMPAGRRQ